MMTPMYQLSRLSTATMDRRTGPLCESLSSPRTEPVAPCSFFFQAEDGIRYLTVTGVQTCALPICRLNERQRAGSELGERSCKRDPGRMVFGRRRWDGDCTDGCGRLQPGGPAARHLLQRSEERRVGKEGRSRWSPYH